MSNRYRIDVWDPTKGAYEECFALITADTPEEVRDIYAKTRRKYGHEPRHQMIKTPRLFRVADKQDPITGNFRMHDPVEISWPES